MYIHSHLIHSTATTKKYNAIQIKILFFTLIVGVMIKCLEHKSSQLFSVHNSVPLSNLKTLCSQACHSLPDLFSSCRTEALYPFDNFPFFPPLDQSTYLMLPVSMNVMYPMPYTNGIIQCLSFCVWLISLSIMFLWFTHVVVCVRIVSLFKTEQCSITNVCHILFYSLVSRHLVFFHLQAIMNKTTLNTGVKISFRSLFYFICEESEVQ